MANSYTETTSLTCPHCGESFDAEIWRIIDAAEQRELVEKIKQGTLHEAACPACNQSLQVKQPFLLFRPDANPALVFVHPEENFTPQEWQTLADLLKRLQQQSGPAWRDEWVQQSIILPYSVARQMLLGQPEADQHQQNSDQPNLLEQALRLLTEEQRQAVIDLIRSSSSAEEFQVGLNAQPDLRQAFEQAIQQVQSNAAQSLQAILNELSRPARLGDMPRRIELCRQALDLAERETQPELWSWLQNELANSLAQTPLGNRAENLEQAIQHYEWALEVYTREAFLEQWATTHNNLGNAYGDRIRGERAENLEQAIGHYQQALEVYTREAFLEQWAGTHNNLGAAYGDRIRGERVENLEQAIGHYEQALAVHTREAFPEDWAMTHNNLGTAYQDRIRGERAENLEQAARHYEQALQFHTPSAIPARARTTAYQLGRTNLEQKNWQAAAKAFTIAREADEALYQAALGATGQEAELSETHDLYILSAYTSARSGAMEEALEAIEQGRARQMRDALEQNRQDLAQLKQLGYEDLYRRYQTARENWSGLSGQAGAGEQPASISLARPEEQFAQLEDLHNEIRAIVTEIQRVPGFENFLRSMNAEEILELSSHMPLVYLAAAKPGGFALIAYKGRIHTLWLDQLDERQLREMMIGPADDPKLGGYLGAYDTWRRIVRDEQSSYAEIMAATERWESAISTGLGWLWDARVGQVISFLQKMGANQVTMIPLGLLGLLPLHAAWTSDPSRPCGRRYAMDEITFRYAPSAHALRTAQASADCPAESLLAIDNPGVDDPKLNLRYSNEEVAAAAQHFQPSATRWLLGDAANLEQVRAMLPSYQVLHFSTHGMAIPGEPLESFLLLANHEHLRLRDILDLRLEQARLAVLSACETGIPGTKLLDEVLALPSGWMQAGVPGVVGSLWSVSDASTMMLMARFYDLWREEGLQPPEALRQAQMWLRDRTNGEKEEYFKRSLPEYQGTKMPEASAREALHQMLLRNKDERSFAHPFYWAAFGYWGV